MNTWRHFRLNVTILASVGMIPCATLLHAQGLAGDPSEVQALLVEAAPHEVPGVRDPGTASLLSIVGTVTPTVLGIVLGNSSDSGSDLGALLVTYGVYFGPATGYVYGGSAGRGFAGVGIRAGISLAGFGLMAAACSGDNCGCCRRPTAGR